MKKVESLLDPIHEVVSVSNKTIVDVGCGTGDVTRLLTQSGAHVTGVDNAEILKKAAEHPKAGDEQYVEGCGEGLPLEDDFADIILMLASLHHVPPNRMVDALKEAARVLKPRGLVIIIEPLITCSYYRITRLAEEETDIRGRAQEAIQKCPHVGLTIHDTRSFYIERTFADYEKLTDIFFRGNENEKYKLLEKAKEITEQLASEAGCTPEAFIFQSACTLFVLKKATDSQ